MANRNAASVFPEPVGADTSTSRPAAISGQPSAWGAVGSPNRPSNQRDTSGWNVWSTVLVIKPRAGRRSPRRGSL